MPLGSPIGSGQGLLNSSNISIIIENSNIPVIVDAGIGVPSEASQAMDLGVNAGRTSFLAGRIEKAIYANPSSPEDNISK